MNNIDTQHTHTYTQHTGLVSGFYRSSHITSCRSICKSSESSERMHMHTYTQKTNTRTNTYPQTYTHRACRRSLQLRQLPPCLRKQRFSKRSPAHLHTHTTHTHTHTNRECRRRVLPQQPRRQLSQCLRRAALTPPFDEKLFSNTLHRCDRVDWWRGE